MQCVPPATIGSIDELRSILETMHRPLTIQELPEFTSKLQLSVADWREHLTFDPHRFCFNTVYASPHFEINVIGWRSGQFSSVHDHRGTACCVLVLDGVLTNIDYRLGSSDALEETLRFDLHPGEILPRSGLEIHRCGNGQPSGIDLATLHLYSPPLRPLAERQHQE